MTDTAARPWVTRWLCVLSALLLACQSKPTSSDTMHASEATSLNDLPLTVLPSPQADTTLPMVVYLSGDGGWNAFSSQFAQALAAIGTPVVGIDALRYFRKRRPPQQVADDMVRIVRYYQRQWQRRSVTLIGYSFGGSVVPFAYHHLPPDIQAEVVSVVIMSPSEHADFKIHLRNLLALDGSDEYPVAPQIANIRIPVLGLYGAQEASDWLEAHPPGTMSLTILPGGHHYAHDYALLARTIREHIRGQRRE